MELVSVAAVAENRVIGADGEIPWGSLPADREQYRARIADDPIILGRRTFDSMRDDLPGIAQIVLSRSIRTIDVETAHVVGTVEDALDAARAVGTGTAYVIGGGEIYALFQPYLDRMVLTRVPGSYDGDTYYPEWSHEDWELVATDTYDDFTIQYWERPSTATRNSR